MDSVHPPGPLLPCLTVVLARTASRHPTLGDAVDGASASRGCCQTTTVIAGQSTGAWLTDVLLGLACVAVGSILVGAAAPRWQAARLRRDRGPLRLLPGEDPQWYRRLGVHWLRRRFPELGAVFGGVSKNIPPDFTDAASIHAYLVEVRRAEWVHWLSMLACLPLPLFQPWWLALGFLVISGLVNGAAQIILRYNKLRLYQLLDLMGAPRTG